MSFFFFRFFIETCQLLNRLRQSCGGDIRDIMESATFRTFYSTFHYCHEFIKFILKMKIEPTFLYLKFSRRVEPENELTLFLVKGKPPVGNPCLNGPCLNGEYGKDSC